MSSVVFGNIPGIFHRIKFIRMMFHNCEFIVLYTPNCVITYTIVLNSEDSFVTQNFSNFSDLY